MIRLFLILNALLLIAAAVFLRSHELGAAPGFNGDEAWYGIRAWAMTHGGEVAWNTPTGNPLNPLYIGPLALLHLAAPPSIALLRVVALASGLAALAINWFCCRWVFDRRTAAVSTVLLAILPVNIAFSRFGWDACQSLAATLPVIYFSLAAVRFPERFGRWIAAALLAQAVAVWVHPTNVFVGATIITAIGARLKPNNKTTKTPVGGRTAIVVLLGLTALLAVAWLWVAWGASDLVEERVARHWGDLSSAAKTTYLVPRLFTGGTVYYDIAGSRSWMDGRGIDVGWFWACVFGSVWLIGVSRSRFSRCDWVLLAAWAMTLAAFVVVAGADALTPGNERFAICLVAPTVLLIARGGVLLWAAASPRWRVVLAAASLSGWFLLADFYVHYFRFIERTGGDAHMAFRTAPVEPKLAALRYILGEAARTGPDGARPGELWIVSSSEWIRWPIEYLAADEHGVRVSETFAEAPAASNVWFVEFADTPQLRQVERQLSGHRTTRQEFLDHGRQPVLCVVHAESDIADR